MAQFSRLEVASVMKETRIISLFFNNDIELSKNVLKAYYNAGLVYLSLPLVAILLMRFLES